MFQLHQSRGTDDRLICGKMSGNNQSATSGQLPLTGVTGSPMTMSPREIREQVDRILNCGGLQHSETLRKLLRYLTEASIEGRADLKEYTIGVDALGKSTDYNPQSDSTVRVQVGKLRQRLDEYYRKEGAEDPILVTLPKGGFQLKFELSPPSLPEDSRPKRRQLAGKWTPVVVASLAAFAIGILVSPASLRPDPVWTPELKELWRPLLASKDPIVLSFDTAMSIDAQGWSHRNAGINEPHEIAASHEWQQLSQRLGNPAVRHTYSYVGFGLVHSAALLTKLFEHGATSTLVKRSVVLSWEDLENSNLVFMGTGKTLAKVGFLLEGSDFRWTPSGVWNLRPRPGESATYSNTVDPLTGELREQYGVISMVPGVREGKRVFVLGGGSSEGDWGAAEYVSKPKYVEELVKQLKTGTNRIPDSYQVVIRIRYESRVPVEIAYVTHHVLPTTRKASPNGLSARVGPPR